MINRKTAADHQISSAFFPHCLVPDYNSPYICTSLGNHQHAGYRNSIREQDNRDVTGEAECYGKPHSAEGRIGICLCFPVEKNDHHDTEDGERNVPVNSP